MKQGAICWFKTIKAENLKLGFKQLDSESYIFIKRKPSSEYMIICIYVVASNSTEMIKSIMDELKMVFHVKDLCEAKYVLGWAIKENKNRKDITTTQEKYIRKFKYI